MSTIVPIILAAGASSRMGRPKALLDFDGRTALDLAREAVRGQGAPIVVLGPDAERIQQQSAPGDVRWGFNRDPAAGQAGSLKAALALLPPEASAFLFLPVDCPLVRASDVERIVRAFEENADAQKTVFIPSHGMRRGHPVLCRREVGDEILSLPPGRPVRDAIHRWPGRIRYVDTPHAYVLMDMDAPEDYARCLESYRGRPREDS